MHILACKAVRSSDEHQVKGRTCDLIPEPIQSRTLQTGSTVPIVTKDIFVSPLPSLTLTMRLQPLQLLFDGLCLHLTMPRHTNIDCYPHLIPPVWRTPLLEEWSIAEGTGKLYPSGAELPSAPLADGGMSIGVSSLLPPRWRNVDSSLAEGYDKLAATF